MKRLIIESSDKSDTAVDIEEKLLKAVDTLQQQRENKQLPDSFLKSQKDIADKLVNKTFRNIVAKISKVLES